MEHEISFMEAGRLDERVESFAAFSRKEKSNDFKGYEKLRHAKKKSRENISREKTNLVNYSQLDYFVKRKVETEGKY